MPSRVADILSEIDSYTPEETASSEGATDIASILSEIDNSPREPAPAPAPRGDVASILNEIERVSAVPVTPPITAPAMQQAGMVRTGVAGRPELAVKRNLFSRAANVAFRNPAYKYLSTAFNPIPAIANAVQPGLGTRIEEGALQAVIPGQLYQPGSAPAEGLVEKAADVVGGTAGTVASFIAPSAATTWIAKSIPAYGRGIAALAAKAPKIAKYIDLAARNLVTFNLRGQAYIPIASTTRDRAQTLKQEALSALAFSAVAPLELIKHVGKPLQGVALTAIGMQGEGPIEDRIMNAIALNILHFGGLLGRKEVKKVLVETMGAPEAEVAKTVEAVATKVEQAVEANPELAAKIEAVKTAPPTKPVQAKAAVPKPPIETTSRSKSATQSTATGRTIPNVMAEVDRRNLRQEMHNFVGELKEAEKNARQGLYGKKAVMNERGEIEGGVNIGSVYPEGFSTGDAAIVAKALEGKPLTPRQADVVERALSEVGRRVFEGMPKQREAAGDFEIGDTVSIDGDPHKVVAKTGGKVVFQDGTRVEYKPEQEVVFDADSARMGPGPLTLEQQTPEQVAAERAKAERVSAMKKGIEAPLKGRPVDTTGDLFDPNAAEAPLFATPTPKPVERPVPPATPVEAPSLADAAHKGSPVTLPKAATAVRVTDQQGRQSVVNAKDFDTLKGAGPYSKVEVGIRGKAGFRVMSDLEAKAKVVPAPRAETPIARDMRQESEAKQKAGFASLPSANVSPQRPSAVVRWLKEQFYPSRGVDRKLYDRWVQLKAERDAAHLYGKVDEAKIQKTIRTLSGGGETKPVRQEVLDILTGNASLEDVAARHGVSPLSPDLGPIREIRAEQAARQIALAESLTGASPELRQAILKNDYYQTRMYERWIMGDQFEPNAADYQNAISMVGTDMAARIGRIADVGSRLAVKKFGVKNPKFAADVAKYLETGDARLLEDLSPTRAKRLDVLRRAYLDVQDLIDTVAQTEHGRVEVVPRLDSITKAAQDVIDYHLGRVEKRATTGGFDISNLRQRTLDQIWRSLYGEITDPAMTQARSTEVQKGLLAQASFFQDMYNQGEGAWWWRRPAPGRTQLGTEKNYADRKRFGSMAGKWVGQETYDLMNPKSDTSALIRTLWQTPLATMRLIRLFGPKTVVRNYITAYTGFAVGSGDAALPTFYKHFVHAHDIIRKVYQKNPAALKELAGLAENGVFRSSSSSIIQDIESGLSTSPKTTAGKLVRNLGGAYAYIDMPTKYAAYKARIDAGMTPEQAVKHVQDLYQNRDRIPKIFGTIGQTGLSDYIGYTYDSSRIAVNQARFANSELKQGNAAPMVGFLVSHGLQALLVAGAATGSIGKAWQKIHQAIRREEGIEPKMLDNTEQSALRDFLPEYYENASLVSWKERKNGQLKVYFIVLSGQTAWAAEDWALGAAQATKESGDPSYFANPALNFAGEKMGPGMWWDAWTTFAKGEPLFSKYKKEGIFDLVENDPRKVRIIAGATAKLVSDIYGGALGDAVEQMVEWAKGKKYRDEQAQKGVYVSSQTPEDIFWGKLAPIRTYRIEKGDMEKRIRSRARDFTDAISKAKRDRNEAARLHLLTRLTGVIANAKTISGDWFDDDEYSAMLKDSGLNTAEAEAVASGDLSGIDAYEPKESKTSLQRVREGSGGIRPMKGLGITKMRGI